MSKGLEALKRIEDDMEYVTRLDYVSPIVRGEVRDELYKIYHRELQDLDIIETALNRLEELDKVLRIIKELFIFQPDKFYPFVRKDITYSNKEKIDLLKEYLK